MWAMAPSTLPLGGTGPFAYLWNTQDTTQDLVGVNGGNYAVTLRDIYQCPYSKNFCDHHGQQTAIQLFLFFFFFFFFFFFY